MEKLGLKDSKYVITKLIKETNNPEKYIIEGKENLEELPEVMLPLLFKRVKYDKYLQERGAKLQLYKQYNVIIADITIRLDEFRRML